MWLVEEGQCNTDEWLYTPKSIFSEDKHLHRLRAWNHRFHTTVENSVFTAKDNWSTVALQKGKYWLCSMVWSLEAYLRRQDWLTACCTLRSKNPKNISATKTDDQNKWHNLFNVHQNSFMKLFRGKKGYGGPGLRTEMENKTERGSKERCWAKLHMCSCLCCLMNYLFKKKKKSWEQIQVYSISWFFLHVATVWLSAVLPWQRIFKSHHSSHFYWNAHMETVV